jgi:hypothetical protein
MQVGRPNHQRLYWRRNRIGSFDDATEKIDVADRQCSCPTAAYSPFGLNARSVGGAGRLTATFTCVAGS